MDEVCIDEYFGLSKWYDRCNLSRRLQFDQIDNVLVFYLPFS